MKQNQPKIPVGNLFKTTVWNLWVGQKICKLLAYY